MLGRVRSIPVALQGSVALGPRLLIGQRQAPSPLRVSRRRATAFGAVQTTQPPWGWEHDRVSVEDGPERKNNKNYEESRGSPPGYESRATE